MLSIKNTISNNFAWISHVSGTRAFHSDNTMRDYVGSDPRTKFPRSTSYQNHVYLFILKPAFKSRSVNIRQTLGKTDQTNSRKIIKTILKYNEGFFYFRSENKSSTTYLVSKSCISMYFEIRLQTMIGED